MSKRDLEDTYQISKVSCGEDNEIRVPERITEGTGSVYTLPILLECLQTEYIHILLQNNYFFQNN